MTYNLTFAEIQTLVNRSEADNATLLKFTFAELLHKDVLRIEEEWRTAHSRESTLRLYHYVALGKNGFSQKFKSHERAFLEVFKGRDDGRILLVSFPKALTEVICDRMSKRRRYIHGDDFVRHKHVYPELLAEGLISRFRATRTKEGNKARDQAISMARHVMEVIRSTPHLQLFDAIDSYVPDTRFASLIGVAESIYHALNDLWIDYPED